MSSRVLLGSETDDGDAGSRVLSERFEILRIARHDDGSGPRSNCDHVGIDDSGRSRLRQQRSHLVRLLGTERDHLTPAEEAPELCLT